MSSIIADLFSLRDSIARIEGSEAFAERLPDGPGVRAATIPLSESSLRLDRILGGGLKRGTLHEVMAASPRDAAAASAFALALAVRCAGSAALIWIVDDRAAWETGTPYRPGLEGLGLAVDMLVMVRTRDTAMTLWATEEALRAGARVVVTELWRARSYDLAASRRLLLAARRRGAMNLLVHGGLGEGDEISSVAETRFAVAACPSERRPSAGHRMPIPGLPGFGVRLTKLRGGGGDPQQAFDRDEVHRLVWDGRGRRFQAAQGSGLQRASAGPRSGVA